MKFEVFHNVSGDASFGLNTVFERNFGPTGYTKRQAETEEERHQLVKVFEFEDVDRPAVLEWMFEEFNVGEGPVAQAYRARRLRSLSVGDVVTVDGQAYSVENAGFQPRRSEELRVVSDPAKAEQLVRERYEFGPREQLTVTVPWTGR